MTSLPYGNEAPRRTIEELLAQGQWMRGFCRRLVGPGDAEDLEQETWLAALRRPPRAQGGQISPRSWLATVARNLAHEGRRSSARRSHREEAAARPEAQQGDSELLARTELAHLVAGEMLALREPFRTTLVMRYVEGLPGPEIALRMGVSPGTVRTRISRALDEVRRRLDALHGGERERWLAALLPIAGSLPRGGLRTGLLTTGLVATIGLSIVWLQNASPERIPPPESTLPADLAVAPLSAPGLTPVTFPEEEPVQERRALATPTSPQATSGLQAPRVAWHYRTSQHAAPLVIGDRVIATGRGIACLDSGDGRVQWSLPQDGRGYWSGPPAHAGELLITAHSSGGVAAFSLAKGELVWSRSFEELGTSAHVGSLVPHPEGALYVAPSGDGLVALRARDGQEVWRASLGGRVELTPATANGLVLAGTTAGTFAAVRSGDGSLAWKHSGGSEYGWTNPVVADDGFVYVGDRGVGGSARRQDAGKLVSQVTGNRGGAIHSFNVETGEHLWGRIFGSTGLSDPFVDGDLLWLGFGSVCMPLQRENGEPVEKLVVRTGRNPFGTPRVLGGQLVFGNLDGHLYAHDASNGELLWSFTLTADHQVGGWATAHGRIYVATGAGILALEETPDAEPLERGTRIVHEPEETDPVIDASTSEASAAIFLSAYEISAGWLRILNPESLTEMELKWFGEEALPVDDALRQATWDTLAAALTGPDDTRCSAALRTVARCSKVDGIADLRDEVLPIAREGSPLLRYDALRALRATGSEAADLELALDSWEVVTLEQRLQMVYLLKGFGEGRIEGRSAERILELLEGIDASSFRDMASGLWGAKVTDELASRLCELAILPEHAAMRYDAIYYVLSTLVDKQPAVVDVLLDALRDANLETANRALWGLGHGVPEPQHARVVEDLLGFAPTAHAYLLQDLKAVVERYGTAEQIARLPR